MWDTYWDATSQQNYTKLDSGAEVVVSQNFQSEGQLAGILAISIAAIISFSAVAILLLSMAAAAWLHRGKEASPASKWIKSPIGVYFLSLLAANILSSVGYVMSLKWAQNGAVRSGPFCTAQAAIKQLGNLSSALWAIVIAIHVFITIFWERKCRRFVAPTVAIAVWVVIFLMVTAVSQAGIANDKMGPWWGVEPFWCGITANYWAEGFLVEYLPMGIAVILTLVLYFLIWLRIRGNIHVGDRGYPTFTIRHRERAARTSSMANQVLWHPLVYSALMAPLFVVRVALLLKVRVPWQALDATTVVFLLSGLANVILYTSTRRFFILPYLMRHARNRSVGHQKQVVSSTQALPQYQREGLESQSVIISTTPTLASLSHAHHSFLQTPSISAPSSLPSVSVDLTSPRQAPKPPSKSSLRASKSLGGSIPARPVDIAPALLVERRLTMQILIPPFSWKNAGSPSPSTPQTSFV